MNKYEQRFFSALKDTFVGHNIKGQSGYVNLLDLKQKYFSQIEPFIQDEINANIEEEAREELFEKLYTFFDCYFNETGTVFFANSQLHRNLYERVYSDRNDVSLFWKTQKLYYVKSEALFDDLETVIEGNTFVFDASEIKHAKGNEKKEIVFYLVSVEPNKLKFKVRYKEQTKYDKINQILNTDTKGTQKYLKEKFPELDNALLITETNGLNVAFFKNAKTHLKETNFLFLDEIHDLQGSVKVELSPSKIDDIFEYLHHNRFTVKVEEIQKAFSIYKKQNEVDYFIHKDAEGFLKEQFDIYLYNWLFNDLKTEFDTQTIVRVQNLKKIAYTIIAYIAKFENEIKAIWEKPKFVRKSNYVFTLDKISQNIDLIKEIIQHPGMASQIDEWKKLYEGVVDENGNEKRKQWKEFENASKVNLNDIIITNLNGDELNSEFQYLPIDTKYFEDLKWKILDSFDNIDKILNGILIKSDNWQALNTTLPKFQNSIDLIYVDPPFNTGDDFDYKDKYQDSTWLTIMNDRIEKSKAFMSYKASFFLHLDPKADFYGRILLENSFGKENFRNQIVWYYRRWNIEGKKLAANHDIISWTVKNPSKYYFNQLFIPKSKKSSAQGKAWKSVIGEDGIRRSIQTDEPTKGVPMPDMWNFSSDSNEELGKVNDLWEISMINPVSKERILITQKPEELLHRIFMMSADKDYRILDYFSGSGTTISTSHKMGFNWIGVEIAEYFDTLILPRMKKVLMGDMEGISKYKDVNWQGGGFFKYYELEQYEDSLANCKYQIIEKDLKSYSFKDDLKQTDALEIDYENENCKIHFENLYPDVDIAETLSNLSGKKIKKLNAERVIFEDNTEIVFSEMTYEKYPWVKPLIWWNSK